MLGILLRDINIRSEMRITLTNDMGDLKIGDIVIGTVLNGWIAFDGVYRKAANYARENLPTTRYAAVIEPTNPTVRYMATIDIGGSQTPAPVPEPVRPLRVEVGGDDYETVNVELRPRV